jgi:cytochrome c
VRFLVLALAASWLAFNGGPASAGDPAAGREMVERLCAGCHAVGATDESRHDAAPPLRDLASRYPVAHLEEAFAEGIIVGHHEIPMPEFMFEPAEIADLIAYLEVVGRE